ncbi:MAG TPA: hypothetical protein VHL11_12155 [Phototrophicaceae bacterium]|jgi:hypothetical protein|nr:hypothetical protein [Phototrophicaceae bacterium]
MSDSYVVETIPHLETFGNVVPEGYQYYEKLITPGEDLVLPGAYLKWYDLYPVDVEITPEQLTETRTFLSEEAVRLKLEGDLGFVILHRAGAVLLLLLTVWRNTNEMWEAVYYKDVTVAGAAGYDVVPQAGNLKGTYCVWELGAIWHERHAWVRFLSSKRDNQAKLDYINDRFSGRV